MLEVRVRGCFPTQYTRGNTGGWGTRPLATGSRQCCGVTWLPYILVRKTTFQN